jgi:hypothetical protein
MTREYINGEGLVPQIVSTDAPWRRIVGFMLQSLPLQDQEPEMKMSY